LSLTQALFWEKLKNPETDFEQKVTKRTKATKTSGDLLAFGTFLSFVRNPTDHCRVKVNKSAHPLTPDF
jgi:hypothetical protein